MKSQKTSIRRLLWMVGLGAIGAAALLFLKSRGITPKGESVGSRLRLHSADVETRMRPFVEKAGLTYPPARLIMVGLKHERVLQLYGAEQKGPFRSIREFPIEAASGYSGPKLKEGDRQVPEGLYEVEYLNPNSSYHLSLKVSYPNEFDRARAAEEGRTNLGGDIMIHGSNMSIGCLAMGDEAAEDLFILAALAGVKNVRVIISPVDFRVRREIPPGAKEAPEWVKDLYLQIEKALTELPKALVSTAPSRAGASTRNQSGAAFRTPPSPSALGETPGYLSGQTARRS